MLHTTLFLALTLGLQQEKPTVNWYDPLSASEITQFDTTSKSIETTLTKFFLEKFPRIIIKKSTYSIEFATDNISYTQLVQNSGKTNKHEPRSVTIIGPEKGGFIFKARLERKDYPHQEVTPQTWSKPYGHSHTTILDTSDGITQLVIFYDYTENSPNGLLGEIIRTLNFKESGPFSKLKQ